MRIGTKSILDCRSSRLVSGLFTPWALVHHHLSLGCELDYSVTQHSPLCTNCFGETLIYLLSYDLIFISAMQILCWEPNRHEIQDFYFWFSSLMRGLVRHWGDISSSSWGNETICICNCICICAEQSSRHISLSWCALSCLLPHQRLVLGLSRWLAGHLYWWDSRIAWESPIKEASSSTANDPLSMQNVSADLWWASNRIRWGGLTC